MNRQYVGRERKRQGRNRVSARSGRVKTLKDGLRRYLCLVRQTHTGTGDIRRATYLYPAILRTPHEKSTRAK